MYEEALSRLSEEARGAVICRVEERMSYAAVAKALGKPSPDAARMAVARALVQLARTMETLAR
jgi:DNA-directed RNA polymerase specialized sigma24 family protein